MKYIHNMLAKNNYWMWVFFANLTQKENYGP